jgi:phospholipid/cholesterol/gamma-HCH transport system substrate-binding protein
VATPARLAGVGVFVLGTLLLLGTALFLVADRQMAFADKVVVYTEFARITGLQPGAIVRVSGARAGSVTGILAPRQPAGKFRVELEITHELHPLVRTDSIASIETEGLVGGSYLAVSSGSADAPQAAPLSTIAGREPFEMADLLQQMSSTMAKVNTTIDDLSTQLNQTIQAVGTTVANTNDLVTGVSGDIRGMAESGARAARDLERLTADVRDGRGTVGKLFGDDELYTRISRVAGNVETMTAEARDTVAHARRVIDDLQGENGPVSGLTTNLRQTLDDARSAMAGFSDNMEALRHNFLFRGFFNRRGYFDLQDVSPAEYRAGALTGDGRHAVRVWLDSARVFEDGTQDENPRLTPDGRARLDSAIAPYLDRVTDGVLMIEGFAQIEGRDQQYLLSRARAAAVREYLVGRFHLDPGATGVMPLGSDSPGSPAGRPWDGVALAFILKTGT